MTETPGPTLAELLEELGDIPIRFWSCPEHHRSIIEWEGDVAYCREPGCPLNSSLPRLFAVVAERRCMYATYDPTDGANCQFPGYVLRAYTDRGEATAFVEKWNAEHRAQRSDATHTCKVEVHPVHLVPAGA
ncbi:hypothetical protein [Aeromicrobium sp. 179-A 4D2 NHS]|uniref:hypothetical protein n=1 Tax=Aeromicrobium sp. 179-A 4D2 NHS TaxID=3142375 RepID=UPI0039A23F16